MGRGWLDFRSREEKERDFREFSERVFRAAWNTEKGCGPD